MSVPLMLAMVPPLIVSLATFVAGHGGNTQPILSKLERIPFCTDAWSSAGKSGGIWLETSSSTFSALATTSSKASRAIFGLTRIELRDEKSPLRFVNGGRQMVVMPVRVEPLKPQPAAEAAAEDGKEKEQPTPAPATAAGPTERSTMPRNTTPTNGAGNGTNGHRVNGTTDKPSIESALEKIDAIKGSCREAIQGLNELADTLKQAQRDQKTASREVQTVRATLEKLQSVKL